MSLRSAVADALDRVVDPCSLAARAPTSLPDMGLVDWELDDTTGDVTLRLMLTSPCCVYGPRMLDAARRELEAVEGVRAVCASIDYDAVWTPARMTADGRAALEARRASSIGLQDVRPYDWGARGGAGAGA